VGNVNLPSLETPVRMTPFQQNYVPDCRFPVRLRAPTGTLLGMFERMMIPNGAIYVDMKINLTFTAGDRRCV